MTERAIPVEVRSAIDPDGRPAILLQFEQGWLVVNPAGARKIASLLRMTADEVDRAIAESPSASVEDGTTAPD